MLVASLLTFAILQQQAGYASPLVEAECLKPVAWPEKLFVALSQNATDPATNKQQPFQSMLKWYDYTQRSQRAECIEEGSDLGLAFLIRDKLGYVFDLSERFCTAFPMVFGMVNRDWFVTDSKFEGFTTLDGIPVAHWSKLNHDYYAALKNFGRPVRILAPLDQLGFSVEMNYAAFVPGKEHPSGLRVPSVCTQPGGQAVMSEDWMRRFNETKGRCFQFKQGPPGPPPPTLVHQF